MSLRRRVIERIERIEGLAFDAILIAVAAAASEDIVQDWLFEHPAALFHGLAALHLVACPVLLVALIFGYGRANAELRRNAGPGLLGWAIALVWGGSFIIPGVLALLFDVAMWEMLTTVFGPLVILVLWLAALVIAERRGWKQPSRVDTPRPWWTIQVIGLLTWAYLLWLETMLLVAASRTGAIPRIGIPIGVLIDYLPIRVCMYYVRNSSRWEVYTITASVLHLLYRIATA